jgi:hypothetical protein
MVEEEEEEKEEMKNSYGVENKNGGQGCVKRKSEERDAAREGAKVEAEREEGEEKQEERGEGEQGEGERDERRGTRVGHTKLMRDRRQRRRVARPQHWPRRASQLHLHLCRPPHLGFVEPHVAHNHLCLPRSRLSSQQLHSLQQKSRCQHIATPSVILFLSPSYSASIQIYQCCIFSIFVFRRCSKYCSTSTCLMRQAQKCLPIGLFFFKKTNQLFIHTHAHTIPVAHSLVVF